MRRGTTPTHFFTCDIDVTQAAKIYITYHQYDKNIIEKTIDDVTFLEDNKISVTLTQKETLKVKSRDYDEQAPKEDSVYIQIRVKYPDESSTASNIMIVPAEAILKGGEI